MRSSVIFKKQQNPDKTMRIPGDSLTGLGLNRSHLKKKKKEWTQIENPQAGKFATYIYTLLISVVRPRQKRGSLHICNF